MNVRGRWGLPKPIIAGRLKARHLPEKNKVIKCPWGRGAMTWMSISCLLGRGERYTGHLAEAGGSPFLTNECSEATQG